LTKAFLAIPSHCGVPLLSKLTIGRFTYEGKVSADGTSIEGVWTQNRKSQPLEFKRATADTAWKDSSPHTVRFVSVDKDVKVQVLDWGGTGRPLVLLTGLGNDAHVYDKFALKLTAAYHVYGITRRGFGVSSAPAPTSENYAADRLGDDVLGVIDSLKLSRPFLVGHSIAGEELSSVGSRHPEKVAGLIYLDAGWPYAYYDRSRGDVFVDSAEVRRKLDLLDPLNPDNNSRGAVRELAETDLPALEKAMRRLLAHLQAESNQSQSHLPPLYQAIFAGEQRYTDIRAPILAIFAFPHNYQSIADPKARDAADAEELETRGAQAKAFEAGLPNARVVRLENADHYVFRSNEADVLREMNAFIAQ
jgi:non-heme chloroperoxidase